MATQEDKTTLNYRVVETENPLTGENVKRPVITNRPTYPLARVVRKAIDSGRIRGKYHDLVGIANGLMDEIQVLMNEGASINTGYQRYHLELTGSVGDDLRLTATNGLKTCITPMSDLKLNVGDFNWHRVDDSGIKLTLSTIKGEGTKLGQVIAGKKATINGRNLVLVEGDTVSAKCAEITEACEVLESDEDHVVIVIPASFNMPELSKKDIIVTLRSRCGNEEEPFQTKSIRATLIVETKPAEPKIVSVVGTNSGEDGVMKKLTDGITINVEGCSLEGAEAQLILRDQTDGHKLADTKFGDPSGNAVFTVKSATEATFYMSSNTTSQPDGSWTTGNGGEVALQIKLADGTILEYPIVIVA